MVRFREPKAQLRCYKFEFSCLLRTSTHVRQSDGELALIAGFVEPAHFCVEIDFAAVKEHTGWPLDFEKAIERIDDLIERRFEGCPILATPLGIDDPDVAAIEALTRGRAYFLRDVSSDAFAHKFKEIGGLPDGGVMVEEVRVRRAGDDYTAIFRETDDER